MKKTAEEADKTEEIVEAEEAGEAEEAEETEEIVEEEIEEAGEEAEGIEEVVEEEEIEAGEEVLAVVEKEKKEVEEEIVEENIYTIPLGRAWISPRKKRAPRATRLLKSFIQRHMKIKTEAEEEGEETERLVVSNEVNEKIWSRGIQKPPRKIRVRAVKDKEGIITVYLAEGD